MVTCKEAMALLADLLENSLQAEEHAAVLRHLSGCPVCEHFLHAYRKTSSLCRKSLAKSAPPELTERLMSYLRHKTRAG